MTTEIISLIIAGAAVIIGPLISLKIATLNNKTNRANSIADKREKWINNFVNLSSKYFTINLKNSLKDDEDQLDYQISILIKLKLHLNPNDKLHREYGDLCKEKLSELLDKKSGKTKKTEGDTQKTNFAELAQKIVYNEWQKIKEGN